VSAFVTVWGRYDNQYRELNVDCGQAVMVLQITGETGARNITALHILKDILWMCQVKSH